MRELYKNLMIAKTIMIEPTPELAILLGKNKKPKPLWDRIKIMIKNKLNNGR